jgi:glutamyl-tRNA reductase
VADLAVIGVPRAGLSTPQALLADLRAAGVGEAVALVTCERTEVYVRGALAPVHAVLTARTGVPAAAWRTTVGPAVVAHLFRVAAGLESRRLGEPEIQGQLRAAGRLAEAEAMLGPQLRRLWRQALVTGKRVRRRTAISRGAASLPAAVVRHARGELGALEGRRAVVVGAGALAAAAGAALARQGLEELVVLNHRAGPAERLAARLGGRAGAFTRLAAELARADLAVCCTAAPGPVVAAADLAALAARHAAAPRSPRPPADAAPLLLFDLAVPPDVSPGAAALDGVRVVALDELAAPALARRREAERAAAIVAEEVGRFLAGPRLTVAAA